MTRLLLTQAKVSIPHRYAKNEYLQFQKPLGLSVSIPHRYAKNVFDATIDALPT